MEEELGLIGASAEDTEAELIRKICETELLAGKKTFSLVKFLYNMEVQLTFFTRFDVKMLRFVTNLTPSPFPPASV